MSSVSATLSLAQRLMVQYCHSTVFVLGVIGSLINILLFSRYQLRSSSCCVYFLASSACGLMLLPIGIVPQLYAFYNSPNPFTTIQSFCKARSYLNQTSAMSCRWLLVFACLDRCSACSASASIRRFSSTSMARKIVVGVISVWMILPAHTLIFSNIQLPGNIACSITDESVAIYHRVYTIIMGGGLPSSIAFTCSVFIWRNFQERRKRRMIPLNDEVNRRKKMQDQQVSVMLIVQVMVFVISSVPFMSFNIYDTMTRTITNKSSDRKAIESFVKTLTELLVYLITLSFYSNTLVSRTFRKEFMTIFKRIVSCGHPRHRWQVNPLSHASVSKNNNTLRTMKIINAPRMILPAVDATNMQE